MQLFRISRVDSSVSDNPHILFRVSNMGRQLTGKLAVWLATIGETTTYTELNEYLADPLNEAQVRKLMTMHVSADFLFDWYLEDNTVISTVMESTIGAKWLGARDYVCDKFMNYKIDSPDLLLYDSGDEKTATTGGWGYNSSLSPSASYPTFAGTYTNTSDHMEYVTTNQPILRASILTANNAIDVTNYGTCKIDISSYEGATDTNIIACGFIVKQAMYMEKLVVIILPVKTRLFHNLAHF